MKEQIKEKEFKNSITVNYEWKLKDHIQKAVDNYPKMAYGHGFTFMSGLGKRPAAKDSKFKVSCVATKYEWRDEDYGTLKVIVYYNGNNKIGNEAMNHVQTFIAGYLLGVNKTNGEN